MKLLRPYCGRIPTCLITSLNNFKASISDPSADLVHIFLEIAWSAQKSHRQHIQHTDRTSQQCILGNCVYYLCRYILVISCMYIYIYLFIYILFWINRHTWNIISTPVLHLIQCYKVYVSINVYAPKFTNTYTAYMHVFKRDIYI